MENQRKFRTSPMGYTKEDVNRYIGILNDKMKDLLAKKDKEIEELNVKVVNLQNENNDLTSKIEEVERERQFISTAIIKAEQEAKKIVDEATLEARNKSQDLAFALIAEEENLRKTQADVVFLKEQALDAIKRYQSELDEILEN